MKKLFAVLFCLGLGWCTTAFSDSGNVTFAASSFNSISLGMAKADVINILGVPSSISAKGNVEYLKYEDNNPNWHWEDRKFSNQPRLLEYFVRWQSRVLWQGG